MRMIKKFFISPIVRHKAEANIKLYIHTLTLLLLVVVLILFPSAASLLSYFFLLWLAVVPLLGVRLEATTKKMAFLGMLASAIFYALLTPSILRIELWGDEINVIQFSQFPFQEIASLVFEHHVAALPLDYWNLWVWNHVVAAFDVSLQEVLYRIPYIFIHSFTAVFFGLLVLKQAQRMDAQKYRSHKIIVDRIVFASSFLLFFLNPLLFYYSIEVRFYALATAGSTLVLFFFFFPEYFRKDHILFLLLLCLNSVSQFVVTGILFLKTYIEKKTVESGFSLLATIALGAFVAHSMLVPNPDVVTVAADKKPLLVFGDFIGLQFPSLVQKAVAAVLVAWAIFLGRARGRLLAGLVVFLLAAVTFVGYGSKYSHFHVRHYVFIVPWMLFFLLFPLASLDRLKRVVAFLLLLMFLAVPWVRYILVSLPSGTVFSKGTIGAKEVARQMRGENIQSTLLIEGNRMHEVPSELYDFFQNALWWYMKQYGVDKNFEVLPEAQACERFLQTQRSILIRLDGDIPCAPSVAQQQKHAIKYKINY